MTCPFRTRDTCQVATDWAGDGIQASTTDQACKVCESCPGPRQLNRVTVSLAMEATRQQRPENYPIILGRSIPYLDKVGNIEAATRYAESTLDWMAKGCPIRTDSEVLQVLDTCKACEQFVKHNEQSGHCQVCGCSVNVYGGFVNKAKRSTEHCPLGKW